MRYRVQYPCDTFMRFCAASRSFVSSWMRCVAHENFRSLPGCTGLRSRGGEGSRSSPAAQMNYVCTNVKRMLQE